MALFQSVTNAKHVVQIVLHAQVQQLNVTVVIIHSIKMEIYVKTIVLIRLLKTIPVGNVRIVKATVTLAKHHRNV